MVTVGVAWTTGKGKNRNDDNEKITGGDVQNGGGNDSTIFDNIIHNIILYPSWNLYVSVGPENERKRSIAENNVSGCNDIMYMRSVYYADRRRRGKRCCGLRRGERGERLEMKYLTGLSATPHGWADGGNDLVTGTNDAIEVDYLFVCVCVCVFIHACVCHSDRANSIGAFRLLSKRTFVWSTRNYNTRTPPAVQPPTAATFDYGINSIRIMRFYNVMCVYFSDNTI